MMHNARMVLLACLAIAAGTAVAGTCDVEPAVLQRGESRDVLLCGSDVRDIATLDGTGGTGVEVLYRQSLRVCRVGGREPGLHLVLRAGPEATSAALLPRRADGAPACDEPVALEVPARLHVGAARLRPARSPGLYDLDLAAPPGVDLSGACSAPWRVEPGEGPAFRPSGSPRCSGGRLRARLQAPGEQRQPASIVVPGVRGRSGSASEAVFQASLPAPDWARAMAPGTERWVDVEGVPTRYFDTGRGPPLVLVHGGQAGGENNHAEVWQQNIPGLARRFRVIALDRLAQGRTGNLPDAADYATYYERDAAHLWGFIRALGLRDVSLVGHSQGGYPVTAVALDHPDTVRCLVNVDSVLVPDDPEPMKAALGFIAYYATVLNPPDGPTFYSARRGLRLRGPSGNNVTDAEAARIVAQAADPKTRAARTAMAAQRLTPLAPAFKRLRDEAWSRIAAGELAAGSLVLWGADDPQVPLSLGLRLFGQLRLGPAVTELHVIDDAGHFPFVEQAGAFERAVTAFCGADAAAR